MMRYALRLCALCLLCGCAAFAAKEEYRDYRAVRLVEGEQARLLAMQRYVERHPDGRWRDELQAGRMAHDRGTFEEGKSTRVGLEFYLAAFPDGEYAAQAKARLSAVSLIEERKREEATRAAQLAKARKQHEVEQSRTWVTRFLGYWVKTLLSVNNWGAPIEEVARGHAEFSRAFGRPPRPRCSADECVKYYESAFGVPVPGGTRVERSMRLLLRLRMEEGRMLRAELLLPAWGFSRWFELEERRVVVDGDPEARNQAVAWAAARVLPLLDLLAKDRELLADYKLAAIPAPAIGPSGELVDTTVADPSTPSDHIRGAPSSEQLTVEELVKPKAPEQAPDMEMAPLRVAPEGQPQTGAQDMVLDPVAIPKAGSGSPDLVLAPIAVPADGAAPQALPPTNQGPQVTPPLTQAFRWGDLRIVFLAASSAESAPAYDGMLIERVVEARAPSRAKRGAGKGAR